MLTIARLFGKSPFAPLQTHMDKVAACIGDLSSLFKVLLEEDKALISEIAQKISKLEHEADLTKNDIRNQLPKSLFLPLERSALLEILALQDSLADLAEEIAHHADTFPFPFSLVPELKEPFSRFCQKNVEVFHLAREVIKELDALLESSFGGIEAQKVKAMVERIAFAEYEMTRMQDLLIKSLYRAAQKLTYPAFHIGLTLIQEIGNLAWTSEKLGNRVRMLLELN